jgi:hypothetical protein
MLTIIGITAYLGAKRFLVTKDVRELVIYMALLAAGSFIALAGMLGYEIPNPNDYIAKVWGPLNKAAGLDIKWR